MTYTRNEIMNCVGEFAWNFGSRFYVTTKYGNFIWFSEDYYGDNSFRQTELSAKEFAGVNFLRDKGQAIVSSRCGNDIKIYDLNGKEVM